MNEGWLWYRKLETLGSVERGRRFPSNQTLATFEFLGKLASSWELAVG